jgi:hypothetical protein
MEYTQNIRRFSKIVFKSCLVNSLAEKSLFLNIHNGTLMLKLAKYWNTIWRSVVREEMCQGNFSSGLVSTTQQQFTLKVIKSIFFHKRFALKIARINIWRRLFATTQNFPVCFLLLIIKHAPPLESNTRCCNIQCTIFSTAAIRVYRNLLNLQISKAVSGVWLLILVYL